MISPTTREYTGSEIAEAIMVYDELRRCGGIRSLGVLDLEKIAAGYRNWHKDVDISWPLSATVEDLTVENGKEPGGREGE